MRDGSDLVELPGSACRRKKPANKFLVSTQVAVLVLDDFGLERLGAAERRALLDVLEDRYDVSSTIVTSQLDPTDWHAVIADDSAADSICDRLVHNAHRIKLDGESIRKTRSSLTTEEKSTKCGTQRFGAGGNRETTIQPMPFLQGRSQRTSSGGRL